MLRSPAETEALGASLAPLLQRRAGGVIYLEGPLGTGKTTLTRGLLRAMGVQGSIRSPTYTLLEPYEIQNCRLLHMDLYRLNHPLELEQLGLRDYPPSQCWWLVEWPERGAGFLPPPDLRITLSHEPDGRHAVCTGELAMEVPGPI